MLVGKESGMNLGCCNKHGFLMKIKIEFGSFAERLIDQSLKPTPNVLSFIIDQIAMQSISGLHFCHEQFQSCLISQ